MLTLFYSDKVQANAFANASLADEAAFVHSTKQGGSDEQVTASGVALAAGLARGMSLATRLVMGADSEGRTLVGGCAPQRWWLGDYLNVEQLGSNSSMTILMPRQAKHLDDLP
jgi:hypothetical protein